MHTFGARMTTCWPLCTTGMQSWGKHHPRSSRDYMGNAWEHFCCHEHQWNQENLHMLNCFLEMQVSNHANHYPVCRSHSCSRLSHGCHIRPNSHTHCHCRHSQTTTRSLQATSTRHQRCCHSTKGGNKWHTRNINSTRHQVIHSLNLNTPAIYQPHQAFQKSHRTIRSHHLWPTHVSNEPSRKTLCFNAWKFQDTKPLSHHRRPLPACIPSNSSVT